MMNTPRTGFFDDDRGDWQERLTAVVETMREMSSETDPQKMVRQYAARMTALLAMDRSMSVSRRDLSPPMYRITRSTTWKEALNPWKDRDKLPVMAGGLLGELLYSDVPRVIDDCQIEADDPAGEYFHGMRSLVAIPQYDHGTALNMVVMMRKEPHAFAKERVPELVWTANLFGRATHNLVLSDQLQAAYDTVDRELKVIADIQRSLLPAKLPKIPTLDLAVHYQTSRRAGGDYYDFFPLPDGRWGILIADVSGHGTPAAVIMAVTHSIAHAYPGTPDPPAKLLSFVNQHLAARYTNGGGNFVTAFYGIYDPKTRGLTYSSAGHPPPRIKSCGGGNVRTLDQAQSLPLGILAQETYDEATATLRLGDQILFFTDGISEAAAPDGEMFGLDRLDAVLSECREDARDMIRAVLAAVGDFAQGRPPEDDQTLLVGMVG